MTVRPHRVMVGTDDGFAAPITVYHANGGSAVHAVLHRIHGIARGADRKRWMADNAHAVLRVRPFCAHVGAGKKRYTLHAENIHAARRFVADRLSGPIEVWPCDELVVLEGLDDATLERCARLMWWDARRGRTLDRLCPEIAVRVRQPPPNRDHLPRTARRAAIVAIRLAMECDEVAPKAYVDVDGTPEEENGRRMERIRAVHGGNLNAATIAWAEDLDMPAEIEPFDFFHRCVLWETAKQYGHAPESLNSDQLARLWNMGARAGL